MADQNAPKPAQNDEIEPLAEESLEEVSGGICSIAACTYQDAALSENP